MILTVTPHPALDVTYRAEHVALGDTQRVDAPSEQAGGKGVNVARVLRQVGHEVLATLPLGGATGDAIRRDLAGGGIPHLAVPVAAESRRTVTVVDTTQGDNFVLSERGRALSTAEVDALRDAVTTQVSQASCLVVSGSLPPEVPATLYADLVRLARAHRVPAIVDASGPGMLEAARAGADLLKPNRAELQAAVQVADPLEGARVLIGLGCSRVVVSLGPEGLMLVTADAVVRARLPEPLRGNPSGAGDAAVAALAVGLSAGADAADLARSATAWSAAAVLAPVAGVLSPHYSELGARVVLHQES